MEDTTVSAKGAIPPTEDLLKKIQELEAGHAQLKQEMSKLMVSNDGRSERQRSHSMSPQRPPRIRGSTDALWKKGSTSFRHSSPLQRESSSKTERCGSSGGGPAAVKLTDKQYLSILQSMGQAVHIFDLNYRIIYWNRSAEQLYGYSAAEAIGQDLLELITDRTDHAVAKIIIHRVKMGENWTGQFPVKNKQGDRFLVVATDTPLYDDDGTFVGIICVSSDARPFQESSAGVKHIKADKSVGRPRSIANARLGLDPQQPLQVAIASKISNLASKVSNKVKSKMKTGEGSILREGGSGDSYHFDHAFSDAALLDQREDANSSGASTPRGDVHVSPFGVFSNVAKEEHSPEKSSRDSGDEGEGKPGISKIITSKAEAWMVKKNLSWPWKGSERELSEAKTTRFVWPWLNNDQDNEWNHFKSSNAVSTPDDQIIESNRTATNEAWGSWSSSFNVNSTSSASSTDSTTSTTVNKVDADTDCLDYEILWEDMTIGEQIGQGMSNFCLLVKFSKINLIRFVDLFLFLRH
ncbi:hypothetical protein HAX54_047970 [Datura stramonium]|uniref:PAS domain-containing protein n=1 Tax=Datura stramonium TaxID=4076 RepID=A0ABS8WIV1_DATST|nr:hypothetical protein [Datura stramonium]